VNKTTVIYVKFLHDVSCQKLFKSAKISRSYSKNNTGTVFLRHGAENILQKFIRNPERVMEVHARRWSDFYTRKETGKKSSFYIILACSKADNEIG